MEFWIFYTDLFGLYQWHRHAAAGDIVDRSSHVFGTIEACYANALASGLPPGDARGGQVLPGRIFVPPDRRSPEIKLKIDKLNAALAAPTFDSKRCHIPLPNT